VQDKAQQSERMLAGLPAHIRCSCNSVDLHSALSGLLQDKAQQSERIFAEMAAQMQQLQSCDLAHSLILVCFLAVQDKAQQSERMLAELPAHICSSCISVALHSASSGLLCCCAGQGLGSLVEYLVSHSIDAKKRSLFFSGQGTQLHLVCCVALQDKAQQSECMLAELPAHICSSCNSVNSHSASSGLLQDKAQQSERILLSCCAGQGTAVRANAGRDGCSDAAATC